MTTTNNISTQSALVSKMAADWPMLSALMQGTRAMREMGAALLPKWPSEDDEDYKRRLAQSVLHPAFSRTVEIMSARPFVQDAKIVPELPDSLKGLMDDCDREGTDFDEFLADRFTDCMSHGLVGVLVDYSIKTNEKGERPMSVADVKAAGGRPYFCVYPCTSILGWRVLDKKLDALRLLEKVEEPDGEYAVKEIEQVRLLRPGTWATYRQDSKKEWILHEQGQYQDSRGNQLQVIPFRFLYGKKLGYGHGVTPLLGLAFQNVEHWQSCSDQQNILHVARVPILFGKGFGDSSIVISANKAATTDSVDGDLKWVEHSGAAIEAGRNSILDLEERMRQAGAELLVKKAIATTATEVISDNEANKSLLQKIVEEFEEGAEDLIRLASLYTEQSEVFADVELFKDFSLDPSSADMDAIFQAHELEILDAATVRNEMARRGIVAPEPEKEEGAETE